MILFTILLLSLLILSVLIILTIGIGGIAFILVFGDVIICIWIIVIIIKHFMKRKK